MNDVTTEPDPAESSPEIDDMLRGRGHPLIEIDPDAPDPLATAVFSALGHASVCWENPGGAGVFDSTRAKAVGDELLRYVREQINAAGSRQMATVERLRSEVIAIASSEMSLRSEVERLQRQLDEARTEITWRSDWSNELAMLTPEHYEASEGTQEGCILAWVKDMQKALQRISHEFPLGSGDAHGEVARLRSWAAAALGEGQPDDDEEGDCG